MTKFARAASIAALAGMAAMIVSVPDRASGQVPPIIIPMQIPTPTAAPTPQVTPPPSLTGTPRPTRYKLQPRGAVYILAAAPDVKTATALTIEVGIRLAPKLADITGMQQGLKPHDNPEDPTGDFEFPMLIPEPSWNLDDLAQQCDKDPQTRGAIIVGPLESDVGTSNVFIFANGYQRLSSAAFLVKCAPPPPPAATPAPTPTPTPVPRPRVRGRMITIVNVNLGSPTPTPSPVPKPPDRVLSIGWYSPDFVQGHAHQAGIPLLPLAALAVVIFGHTTQTQYPYYVSTAKDPTNSTVTTNNGGTSSTVNGTTGGTTTGGSTGTTVTTGPTGTTIGTTTGTTTGGATGTSTTTTTGAPVTNTATTVGTGGGQTVFNSAQRTKSDAATAATLGQLFSVGGNYANVIFPSSVDSTMLKRSAARLANDLAERLKEACGNGPKHGGPYVLISGKKACTDVLGVQFVDREK
jgi:hypothetical protein